MSEPTMSLGDMALFAPRVIGAILATGCLLIIAGIGWAGLAADSRDRLRNPRTDGHHGHACPKHKP